MTIAAGFLSPDGLVLAADTQYSGENKRNAAKVWWFRKGDNVVALAGAGDATLIRRAKHEIERDLSETMTSHAVVRLADDIVGSILRQQLPVDPEASCAFLLGIRTPDGLSPWENAGGAVFAPVDGKSQCIGCGRSLGLYFTDWLFKPHIPTMWAPTIAAHLLKQVKKYVPDCGGDSHILAVPLSSGEPYYLAPEIVDSLEKQLDRIEAAMRKVVIFAPGIEGVTVNSAETIEKRMAAMDEAVKAARTQYVTLTGVVGLSGVGILRPAKLPPVSFTPLVSQTSDSLSSPSGEGPVRKDE